MALMDRSGEFKLETPSENLGQGKISNSGQHLVTAKSLIDFINDESIKNIAAMKIDVEGNEESIAIFLKKKIILFENQFFPTFLVIEIIIFIIKFGS